MIHRRTFLTAGAGAACWHRPVAAASKGEDYFPPPDSEGGWRTLKDPDRVRKQTGFSMDRLHQGVGRAMRTSQHGGLLIARHGWLVYERYFGRAGREVTPNMFSVGKSFTSLCCGI